MLQIIEERYQILEEIGIGGMGKVYRGLDTLTQQEVAVKSLKPEVVNPEMIERFQREGQALRELNHPNIVKMLDTVESDGRHYLIMEYVSGGDLQELLLNEKLSIERVLKLGIEIADALTRAHHLQIIHRDIKPANVLIAADGTPRLTDFGVAYMAKKERVTDSNAVVGTLDYLAPELFHAEAVLDNRADIWSFGVLLFEMITGHKPFESEGMAELIHAIVYNPLPDLEELRPDAPVGLIDLVYRMLERDKNARMASVRLVGAGLEAIMHGRDSQTDMPVTARFVTPTPDSFVRAKHNLPSQVTEFVGREAELEELTNLLNERTVRLVTILAPGGMGKTRLALELAERCMATVITDTSGRGFGDGIYFVELAPLRDVAGIVTAIADAMGYSLDEGDQKSQLLGYLGQKRLLLVMDNYEHLAEGASLVTDILNAAPEIQIVVTSRQRLQQSGETLFHLSGMDVPNWRSPKEAMNYAAVKLFLQGAKRIRPDFALTEQNLNSVGQICRLVQGMPLAIVLSAAWLGVLSEQEIAEELQSGLDFLEGESGNVPDRQRSIRAVFDYSWQMMSDDEQIIFEKMSIFRGGFTREAVQGVTGANLRTLMSLVNKSMIRREANNGRYHIHELLRQYAEEKLGEDPQKLEDALRAHTEYYIDILAANRSILNVGAKQVQIIRDTNDDWDNIRAAWQRVIDTEDIDKIYRAGLAHYGFCQVQSFYLESQTALDKAITVVRRQNLEDSHIAEILAELLTAYSWMCIRLGAFQKAEDAAKEALMLYTKHNIVSLTDDTAADPRAPLSILASIRGDYDEALRLSEEARDRAESQGNEPFNHLFSYYTMTSAWLGKGNFEEARKAAEKGNQGAIDIRADWIRVYIVNDLGNVARAMGDYEEAKKHFQTGYRLRLAFNDPEGIAVTASHLAEIAFLQEDYAEARRLFQDSLQLYSDLGDRGGLATVLKGLGQVACVLDDNDEARKYLRQALELSMSIDFISLTLSILNAIGEALLRAGQYELGAKVVTITANHGAVDHETKDKANELLAEFKENLSQEAYAAAHEAGVNADLNQVNQELLRELA